MSLTEFLDKNAPDLKGLLEDITTAAKAIHKKLSIAGLSDIFGEQGDKNVSGDEVKKLDIISNDIIIKEIKKGGWCAGLASEENEDFMVFENLASDKGKYVMCIDPLDGSSNIDVNIPVGIIFAVYNKVSEKERCDLKDFLQKGEKQAMAGYVLYGTSTILVFTTGSGVYGFTYDASKEEFYLSHSNIQVPKNGKIYSINEGNLNDYAKGVQAYIQYCKEEDKSTNRPYSLRYVGSMVADIHRNLLKGGIFIYPASAKNPKGKLRLLYECNPMAFIVEQAGGLATNGDIRIMEILPEDLHQRTSVIIGSEDMVTKAETFN